MLNLKNLLGKGGNPFGDDLVQTNIKNSLARNLPELFKVPEHGGTVNIVAGGPSIYSQLERLSIAKSPIWAINGAAKYLINNGIKPDCMVILDSSDCIEDMIPDEDIKFYVASQASPKVFDKLKGRKVKVWHAIVNAKEEDVIRERRKDYVLLGGGSTCALRCFNLAYLLGFREIHVYGMDSSFKDNSHVYDAPSSDQRITVRFNGKDYVTNPQMARQANDFVDMMMYFDEMQSFRKMDEIGMVFFGSGLLQDIAKELGFCVIK